MKGISKDYIMEIGIPPINFILDDHKRNMIIMKGSLEMKDNHDKIFKKEALLQVTYLNENEEAGDIDEDGELMVQYYRV